MAAAAPAAAQDLHDHTIDVPVVIGPLLLRLLVLTAVPAVAGFAVMRGFLPAPTRPTAAFVAISAAVAVVLELMLAGGFTLPRQVAVLALAAVAAPVALVLSRSPAVAKALPRATRAVPWVLAAAAAAAMVEFAQALLGDPSARAVTLHSGTIVALAGLSWMTLGLPGSRPWRWVTLVLASALGICVIGAAAQAAVL